MGRQSDNISRTGIHVDKTLLSGADCFYRVSMDALSVISANLARLKASHKQYNTFQAIERRTAELGHKVGKSTIQRMIQQPTPLGLQAVEALAGVYGLQAWQLLVPDLDPEHPPALRAKSSLDDEIRRLAALVLSSRDAPRT